MFQDKQIFCAAPDLSGGYTTAGHFRIVSVVGPVNLSVIGLIQTSFCALTSEGGRYEREKRRSCIDSASAVLLGVVRLCNAIAKSRRSRLTARLGHQGEHANIFKRMS